MPIIKDAEQVNPDGQTPPPSQSDDPRLNWSVILDAPEVPSFLKKSESTRAKEYRTKINSLLNVGLQLRLAAGDLADVSTILQRGPAVSLTAGEFADNNETFREVLDVITAPDNPAILFAVAAIPMVMQFFRNHEAQIQDSRNIRAAKKNMTREERKAAKASQPKVELHFLGRTIRLPFRFRFDLGKMLRMNTVEPGYLIQTIIGDEKIRKELSKRYGVRWDAKSTDT